MVVDLILHCTLFILIHPYFILFHRIPQFLHISSMLVPLQSGPASSSKFSAVGSCGSPCTLTRKNRQGHGKLVKLCPLYSWITVICNITPLVVSICQESVLGFNDPIQPTNPLTDFGLHLCFCCYGILINRGLQDLDAGHLCTGAPVWGTCMDWISWHFYCFLIGYYVFQFISRYHDKGELLQFRKHAVHHSIYTIAMHPPASHEPMNDIIQAIKGFLKHLLHLEESWTEHWTIGNTMEHPFDPLWSF